MIARPFKTPRSYASWLALFILIGTAFYTWQTQRPSADAFSDDAPAAFSHDRAMHHLRAITQAPHFTGAEGHADVRNYLIAELEKLGLEVSVQSALALSSKRFVSSRVKNIVARKRGTQSLESGRKALLLMSHYDSATASSFGASDAGSGVVTILEAMRALMAAKTPHVNDIVVLFTDAEEQGLLGAEAFVAEHPWAGKVGLVVNFEARGSGGPSYTLLETNSGNRQLVSVLQEANLGFPQADSLSYSIYKLLPNDTDLTVFREQADINGLNFAYIDDHYDYHTEQDTADRLDPQTLNHQADYLTKLLAVLKDKDLSTVTDEQDEVYVNLANLGIVSYGFDWIGPFTILVVLLWLGATTSGFRREKLCIKPVLIGTAGYLGLLLLAYGIAWAGWSAMTYFHPGTALMPQDFTYNGHLLTLALIALTLSAVFAVAKRFDPQQQFSLQLFPLLLWVVINLAIALYLPGANFLLLPLLGAVVMMLFGMVTPGWFQRYPWFMVLFALPGLMVTVLLPVTLVVGLGMKMLPAATLLTVLIASLHMPVLRLLPVFRFLPAVMLLVSAVLMTAALDKAGFNPQARQANNVNYLHNADSQTGFVMSYDMTLDEFTRQFFSEQDTDTAVVSSLYPMSPRRRAHYATSVPPLAMEQAQVYNRVEATSDGSITLTINVQPQRQNHLLLLSAHSPLTVHSLSLDGRAFKRTEREIESGVIVRHVMTGEEQLDITMNYSADSPPILRLQEIRFDLPSQWPDWTPRQAHQMPTPFRYSDATIISQAVTVSATTQ